jgi:hypothetical protein
VLTVWVFSTAAYKCHIKTADHKRGFLQVLAGFDLMIGPGFIFKHLLVLLKIEPICDSVFNTRSLNIEAASVGGLIFIWANHFEKRLPGLQRLD